MNAIPCKSKVWMKRPSIPTLTFLSIHVDERMCFVAKLVIELFMKLRIISRSSNHHIRLKWRCDEKSKLIILYERFIIHFSKWNFCWRPMKLAMLHLRNFKPCSSSLTSSFISIFEFTSNKAYHKKKKRSKVSAHRI